MACLLAALTAAPAHAATTQGAVISNGTVTLGVNAEGDLNYDCTGAGDSGCPAPSAGEGELLVGLRYAPLNLDAISPGCECEGWGLADAASGLSGFANEYEPFGGSANITVEDFSAPSNERAISTVSISDPSISGYEMQVVHDYHPSPVTPNLYVDTITVTNTGTNPLTDLRFRRVMDWDVEPTAFNEWVTIQGTSPELMFDSDDGFATSNPLAPKTYLESDLPSVCGAGYTGPCQFTDLGTGGTYPGVTTPDDHGALFDFGFGALGVGDSRSFNVYYGAANSEAAALSALSAGGAQVYSLGQPDCSGGTIATCADGSGGHAGVELGMPATFIFGFVTTVADVSITKSDSPDPVEAGENLTYSITVDNNGPGVAAGVHVTDPLPPGVELVSATSDQGSCGGASTVTCDLGSIGASGSAHVTIVVKPTAAAVGTLSNTATVSTTSSDENSSNDSASATTTVTPASTVSKLPPPVLFENANAAFVSGTVLVRRPDGSFEPLTGEEQIPLGSIVDVSNGVVAITSAKNAAGATQTGKFYGGVFKLLQVKGKDGDGDDIVITQLVLVNDPGARLGRVLARKGSRKIWGSGKGNYKTKGGYGSATVRGTKWLTRDSDAGTLVKVIRGVVSVRDFARKRTVKVGAGHKLLVTPPGRPPGEVH